MPERRHETRPDWADRRSFPRPPLWLNLVLLILAAATFLYARHERQTIREKTAILFKSNPNSPGELNRIRSELVEMDLTKAQLAKELDGRMQYLQSLQGEEFYISIDTSKKRFEFRLGKEVVRDAPIEIGEAKTIKGAGDKTWTFVPLKGGFNVEAKDTDYVWRVPEWLNAMNGDPNAERPNIRNGLGRYVIVLPNHYVIHSPPPEGSPLKGAKPGSFMVPEEDLAAIWPRISKQTRVYIF